MKYCAIIEARTNSSRLPGKILKKVLDKTLIEIMVERVKNSKLLDDVIVATTDDSIDNNLVKVLKNKKIKYFRGSEKDVMHRVLSAANFFKVKNIVEIPGDCPLIDPFYIDLFINEFEKRNVDYLSSHLSKNFPNGFEVQIFRTKTLEDAYSRNVSDEDKEHVSLYIYNNPKLYKIYSVESPLDKKFGKIKLTLDTKEDLKNISEIIKKLYPLNNKFNLSDIIENFYKHL